MLYLFYYKYRADLIYAKPIVFQKYLKDEIYIQIIITRSRKLLFWVLWL